MKHYDGREHSLSEILGRGKLCEMLADELWSFGQDELETIIHNEFFNDDVPLNSELVNMALRRMLLLKGICPNDEIMQLEKEKMISGILREIMESKKIK